MDRFLFFGGVGSLAAAWVCYSAYRSFKDVISYLTETENLEIGKDLFEKIKLAPNQTLDYVVIRGNARAIETTLSSRNVPAARLLIQRTTLYEHKAEWAQTSKVWHDTKHVISKVINYVPFSLNSPNSSDRVIIDEPMSTTGLEYNIIYDKYEPLNSSSVSATIMEWASGEKTKGIETIEAGLLEETALTAVGKLTLEHGGMKMKPPDGYEYILSRLPLQSIIREKTDSAQYWKYISIGFAITGSVLLVIWLCRRWRSRVERVLRGRFAPPPEGNLEFMEDVPAGDEEQACVICLTHRRSVVILDCGHICACRACALQLDLCPICRAEIIRLVPTYHS